MVDHFEQARAVLFSHISKICAALPELWGDTAVECNKVLHETDAPNVVSLWAVPANLNTVSFATNHSDQFAFTVQAFIRCTNADEEIALDRASHLVWSLLSIPNADPHLSLTVQRVDARVGEWSFGTDNSKLSTAVSRVDFECVVANANAAEIAALIRD